MAESRFKTNILIPRLEQMFPDCIIMHLNPNEIQGIPDLVIFFGPKWATLEAKDNRSASVQKNQPYWVEVMNNMSFSAFIFPDNMEDVLRQLDYYFYN